MDGCSVRCMGMIIMSSAMANKIVEVEDEDERNRRCMQKIIMETSGGPAVVSDEMSLQKNAKGRFTSVSRTVANFIHLRSAFPGKITSP